MGFRGHSDCPDWAAHVTDSSVLKSQSQLFASAPRTMKRSERAFSISKEPSQKPAGGSRTPEGKAVSSQNAFSHGLTAARAPGPPLGKPG